MFKYLIVTGEERSPDRPHTLRRSTGSGSCRGRRRRSLHRRIPSGQLSPPRDTQTCLADSAQTRRQFVWFALEESVSFAKARKSQEKLGRTGSRSRAFLETLEFKPVTDGVVLFDETCKRVVSILAQGRGKPARRQPSPMATASSRVKWRSSAVRTTPGCSDTAQSPRRVSATAKRMLAVLLCPYRANFS